jgi:hypothetical protein
MPQEVNSTRANPRRHCWECQRRRRVCDFSLPSCNKCIAAGIECPGYGEKKPLRWVAPGKVTSWTRQRQRPVNPQDRSRSAGAAASNEETTEDMQVISQRPENQALDSRIPLAKLTTDSCAALEAVLYCKLCRLPLLPLCFTHRGKLTRILFGQTIPVSTQLSPQCMT